MIGKSFCLLEPPHSLQIVTRDSLGGDRALVLAPSVDGHVGSRSSPYWSLLRLVTWSSDRLSNMSWMTSSTGIRPDGITSYLLMSAGLVVCAPLKAAVHAGSDAFVLQPASLWLYIRGFTEG